MPLIDIKKELLTATKLHEQGLLDGAQQCYKAIIKIDPENFDALHLCGLVNYEKKEYQSAINFFKKAIEINKGFYAAYTNLGCALYHLQEYNQAIINYDLALSIQPHYLPALLNKATSLFALKKYDDSLRVCNEFLITESNDAVAWMIHGNNLIELDRYEEALASYDKSLSIKKLLNINDQIQILVKKSLALSALNRYEEAFVIFEKDLILINSCDNLFEKSDQIILLNNKGRLLNQLMRYDEALTIFNKILLMDPKHAETMLDAANTLCLLNRTREALMLLNKITTTRPDLITMVKYNQAFCYLVMGDFKNGLEKYELRWKIEEKGSGHKFKEPLWLGNESLNGKTIFLHSEQGLGDTILALRYVEKVVALGARVILGVQPELKSIATTLNGIDQVITHGNYSPTCDYQCPLMSLPLAFKTQLETIPHNIPYLRSNIEKVNVWLKKISFIKNKRIGIVWSGNPKNKTDKIRSMPLTEMVKLKQPGITLICLKKEISENEKLILNNHEILYFDDQLHDFSDTAALIECLDLVISIDSSVAHLTGAIGKPVWILLPYSADWRWFLNREDSPWYPSAMLFRQSQPGDWANLIKKVSQKLITHYKIMASN